MKVINALQHLGTRSAALICAAIVCLVLASCGGGGSSTSSSGATSGTAPSSDKGDLIISLGDAAGDFLSYTVDITSIKMTRANGAVVETLPESSRIDFAQYVNLNELLTVASVPLGRYTDASITLDFTDAEITVQGPDGQPLPATAVDDMGAPLGSVTLDVQLKGQNRFVVSPGVQSHFALDFDLEASNTVTINGDAATVAVSPVLLADTAHVDQRDMRLRGLLMGVDTEQHSFNVDLRPFRHRNGHFGEATVYVDDNTSYEINGEAVDSATGLTALDALPDNTAVVAEGNWNNSTHQYLASAVYAGSSVPWGSKDMLRGTVTSRSGNTVVVRGGAVEFANGRTIFNDEVQLQLADTTTVMKDGHSGSIANISVGSEIVASGMMSDESDMDASNGIVSVRPSSIAGTVVSTDPLVVDLQRIDGRQIEVFDFSGSGTSADVDADPHAYEIDTSLPLDNLMAGDPVRLRGYVADFGSAPADFDAFTSVDYSDALARLALNFEEGASAISSLDSSALVFDLSQTDSRHEVFNLAILSELGSSGSLSVMPADGSGLFAISMNHSVEVYSDFASFSAALQTALDAGATVKRCDAVGTYDSLAATFTTAHLLLELHEMESD